MNYRAGQIIVPRFSYSSMPIGRISTPQTISISQFNRTSQNPIYLALETQFIEYETSSESDSGYVKSVANNQKSNLLTERITTMNYLLIEERAWTNLQAHARRLTDTMRRLDCHFNPAAESG